MIRLKVTCESWLTATLSVLTIALTILGVVIAIAALYGWSGIKKEAKTAAEACAKEAVNGYITGEQIGDKLRREIEQRVKQEAEGLWANLSLSQAFTIPPIPGQKAVADRYPDEGSEGKAHDGDTEAT
jgi:hypothetical protein